MATRFAGQKLRATYAPISGGVTNQRLLAADVSGAVAGAEPLCTQFT
jgi:hypothetical protein